MKKKILSVVLGAGLFCAAVSASIGGVDNAWQAASVSGVVPNPEIWVTLLAGLGMVGVAARRRRQR